MSWWIAEQLVADGHDAVHVKDLGLLSTADDVIFERARQEQRTIITADTDYGTIAARLRAPGPSIILFRNEAPDFPPRQLPLLRGIISAHAGAIDHGSIIVLDGKQIRIRALPIES